MTNAYDVVWHRQSVDSGDSMPVGGFDTGANVWVENGEVMMYLDRSGSFDENNQMLKLGRLRFCFDPCPFSACFEQRLNLNTGDVTILGDNGFSMRIWFHTDSPMARIDLRLPESCRAFVAYETWRTQKTPLSRRHGCAAMSYQDYPGPVFTWPDRIDAEDNCLFFRHCNRPDALLFDFLIEQQRLTDVRDRLWNPQKDFIFGGMLLGKSLRFDGIYEESYAEIPCQSYRYEIIPQSVCSLAVGFCDIHGCDEEWMKAVREESIYQFSREDAREAAHAWWKSYWERCRIDINAETGENDVGFRVGRNFNLFRYMLGCNAKGSFPTKFNGGLFTTDPVYMVGSDYAEETPDYRRWGGGSTTGQNQRLVYWPMLKTGDFDMMRPQFNFYINALPNSLIRTKRYFGHDGCSFPEQVENSGLMVGLCWGFEKSISGNYDRSGDMEPYEARCPWIRYEYQSQLEFAYMMLQFAEYTGEDVGQFMPFIDGCLNFFSEHYEMLHFRSSNSALDSEGKWVIAPSTALETYKNAVNPTDVLAALTAVLDSLIRIFSDSPELERYKAMRKKVPEIRTREMDGYKCIAPAYAYTDIINHELPQLYPVFPYGLYGIGHDGLQLARDTYYFGVDLPTQRGYESWRQDGIFAARLGLMEEARRVTIQKLDNGEKRFPAFWGPGYDWSPDHNWGGSAMIGLEEMLVQCVDDTLYLFPAWPVDWNVSFRLHLPGKTLIDGSLCGGKAKWKLTGKREWKVILPQGIKEI